MTQEPRPYSEYKDSGLPWLGRVPAHWDIRRNGRLFAQRNETGYGSLPILEVSLRTGVRVRDMDDLKRKQVMSDREKYKRAVKNDIAYNMMRMWQGAVGVAPEDGLVSPAYVVARPYPEAEPRYFSYLFRTDAYKHEADGYSRGIVKDRNRLYWEDFKRMPSCVPPRDEQQAIADYLDANATQVRRFIRNRQRLIEVLGEQKQAIINQAVTRGLDPNVALKPSGIDWLGDIPEHWDVLRSKFLFREMDSRSKAGEETHLSMTQRHGLIRSAEIQERRLMSESYAGGKLCERNDLVLNRLKAHLGVFALAPEPGVVSPDYTVLRPRRKLCPAFYEYLYRTPLCRVELRSRAKGIVEGFWRLYTDSFYDIRVPVPPMAEQEKIVVALGEGFHDVSLALQKAHAEIDLIREYRTIMVADVVTGKVDVRHLAPKTVEADDEYVERIDADEAIDDDILEDDDAQVLVELTGDEENRVCP